MILSIFIFNKYNVTNINYLKKYKNIKIKNIKHFF